jgi:HAMP domain-containing protein
VPAWAVIVFVVVLLVLAAWCVRLDARIDRLERIEQTIENMKPRYAGD